ncbi:hypothetical protein L6452_16912 [Arctium lappa]|uniref:Uncharacterized protein n=1 Tax=Arctium lappa TaxID=4217 RepID=A0ACB9C204_ARCLA|nr:hypothetical protein L6452_16912 [Arctium lappa]
MQISCIAGNNFLQSCICITNKLSHHNGNILYMSGLWFLISLGNFGGLGGGTSKLNGGSHWESCVSKMSCCYGEEKNRGEADVSLPLVRSVF